MTLIVFIEEIHTYYMFKERLTLRLETFKLSAFKVPFDEDCNYRFSLTRQMHFDVPKY